MVSLIRVGRRGASTLGCLFSLMITMVVLYYALNIGRVWWRYYELLDRMESSARFASSTPDDEILRNLQAEVREIGLPLEAARFQIVRRQAPREITITTEYRERVELPFVHRTFTFKPSVHQRL